MKTFNFFEPNHGGDQQSSIIDRFREHKLAFNGLIKEARLKNLEGIKIPTALGEKIRFYIPECFEFILAHEDRHILQMKDLLEKQHKLPL